MPLTALLEQAVICAARDFTRCAAKFPGKPAVWGDALDSLDGAMRALDIHLDGELARRERKQVNDDGERGNG